MRTKRGFATLIAITMAAGGCAVLPRSGEPHEFAIEVPTREPIGQTGSGPQQGSAPERLISDFLLASSAGTFDDYATAKRYLMPTTAESWNPVEQVVIFPTDQDLVPELAEQMPGFARVTLDVPTIGTVDAAGILTELPSPGTTTLEFTLTKDEDGEWRVDTLDDGLVLSQSSFSTGFYQFDLYFASADGETLIADPRWLPRLRLSSYAVKGLLDGPSESIAPAVMRGLGEGLTLPAIGVEVRNRVAYVDLEGELSGDEEIRSLFRWQISQTLRQVPNVSSTEVRINLIELDPDSEPAGPSYLADRITAVVEGSIVSGPPNAVETVVPDSRLESEPKFPVLGPVTQSPLAWVDGEGQKLMILRQGAADLSAVDIAGVTKPSIDRFGNIWTTDAAGTVLVIGASDEAVAVEISAEGKAQRVSVSPDGARVALLMSNQGHESVWIGTVAISEGQPTVQNLVQNEQVGPNAIDISWARSTYLLALIEDEGSSVVALPIGGWVQRIAGLPDGARWISGASGSTGVILQREDQMAYQLTGVAWRPMGESLHYISTVG